MTDKVKGPASYFPSIEKKYGQPIAHWQDLIRARLPAKHMELVSFLKDEYAMGHGHANALVAATLAEGYSKPCPFRIPLARPVQSLARPRHRRAIQRPDPAGRRRQDPAFLLNVRTRAQASMQRWRMRLKRRWWRWPAGLRRPTMSYTCLPIGEVNMLTAPAM